MQNMSFIPWTFSTPICCSRDTPNTNSTSYTSSTNVSNVSSNLSSASILRSSSLFTRNREKRKRVTIVSPLKWDCKQRKRDFINTTISYCDIKYVLRSIGLDTSGGYEECVERLLQSNWIPETKYIQYYEKLRAKPIFKENERIINLECGEINYLQQFSINELKKWLKYNNIQQPKNQNKYRYMQLINKNYTFKSPSPNSFRFKLPPKTPSNKTNYTHIKSSNNVTYDDLNDFDDDDLPVRMQLCFDD